MLQLKVYITFHNYKGLMKKDFNLFQYKVILWYFLFQ